MKNKIKKCACGSKEFISEPNQYDVYEIIDGELVLQKSEPIEEKLKLFCRECSKELNLV